MNRKKIKFQLSSILFIILVIFYLITRVTFISVTDLEHGDASSRALMGVEFSLNKETFLFRDWLPLPFLIFNFALKIFNDPILVPRLISLIFGLFSIIAIYQIGKNVFNEAVGLLASFLAILHPLNLRLETQPLSESMSTGFILWAFFFLLKYFKEKKIAFLFFSSIMFSLASLVRYEAHILIPSFTARLFIEDLFLHRPTKKAIILFLFFLIVSSFFLINSAFQNFINLKDPFPFFTYKKEIAWRSVPDIPFYNLPLAILRVSLGFISLLGLNVPLFLIGIVAAANFLKKNRFLFFLLLFPILIIISAFITLVYTAYQELTGPRFFHLPLVFSLFFIAAGVDSLAKKVKKSSSLFYLTLLAFVAFQIIPFSNTQIPWETQQKVIQIPWETQQVISWLKENVPDQNLVLIDQSKYFEGARIVLYSGIKNYKILTDYEGANRYLKKLNEFPFLKPKVLIVEKNSPLEDYLKSHFLKKNGKAKIVLNNSKFTIYSQ